MMKSFLNFIRTNALAQALAAMFLVSYLAFCVTLYVAEYVITVPVAILAGIAIYSGSWLMANYVDAQKWKMAISPYKLMLFHATVFVALIAANTQLPS